MAGRNEQHSKLIARELLRRQGLERVAKGRPGRDTELGKGAVEVTADGPVRQEQPLRDLLVRQARCREADDLELLGRQTVQDVITRSWLGLSGRPKLRARAVHPRSGAEALEDGERGGELRPSLRQRPAAPEAFSVRQPHPGQIELPALDSGE